MGNVQRAWARRGGRGRAGPPAGRRGRLDVDRYPSPLPPVAPCPDRRVRTPGWASRMRAPGPPADGSTSADRRPRSRSNPRGKPHADEGRGHAPGVSFHRSALAARERGGERPARARGRLAGVLLRGVWCGVARWGPMGTFLAAGPCAVKRAALLFGIDGQAPSVSGARHTRRRTPMETCPTCASAHRTLIGAATESPMYYCTRCGTTRPVVAPVPCEYHAGCADAAAFASSCAACFGVSA